jgi:hypothetical protein
MVRIIIATCAGIGVLSAISAQARFCARLWLFQPDSLFPSYRDSSQGSEWAVASTGRGLGAASDRPAANFDADPAADWRDRRPVWGKRAFLSSEG